MRRDYNTGKEGESKQEKMRERERERAINGEKERRRYCKMNKDECLKLEPSKAY